MSLLDRRSVVLAMIVAGCGPDAGDDACDDGPVCLDGGICLGAARVVPIDLAALHLVAADVDGDDDIDVVAIGLHEDGSVAAELHRGHGDGTFDDPTAIAATGCSAYPQGGDLDGDGAADLVYPDCNGGVLVFWGGADGPGSAPTMVMLEFTMTGSAVADVNADGVDDLVVVGHDPDAMAYLGWVPGAADRNLAIGSSMQMDGLAFMPTAVRTGDADGDGTPDAFAYTSGVVDALAVAHGQPGGGFGGVEPTTLGSRVGQIAVGVFSPSAAGADVLVAAPEDMRLVVADISAAPTVATTPVYPYRPALPIAVEWDGEAGDEALLADGFDPEVRWFAFTANATATERGRISTPYAAQLVLVPDLDGDDVPDLLVGHFAQSAFSVRLSTEGSG